MHGFFGKSDHFNQLLVQYWEEMYRVCFSWCHDPQLAADLVQSSMESALANHKRFSNAEYLKKWLFTVLVNNWRDHCRKSRKLAGLDGVNLGSEHSPETDQLHLEKVRQIYRCMDRLSAEQREVLALVALQGFSYAEVADILDIPTGTVMSRLCRARKCLRTLLGRVDESAGTERPVRSIQ